MATTIFLVNPQTFPTTGFTNTNSLLFDGIDEYVDCGRVTMLESAANLSFSAWVKIASTGTSKRFIGKGNSTTQFLEFEYSNTNRLIGFVGGTANLGFTAANLLSVGTWYHVVMTYDGAGVTNADKLKIYLNGSSQALTFSGTIPTTTSANTQNTSIGGSGYFPNRWMNGNIDEVRIYNYTLSGTDVTDIYNSGVPKADDLATPAVHYWRNGDGDTFPTITDVGTTGGNNGTMTNMESGDIVTDTP